MSTQYICRNDNRHQAVEASSTLNGVDYIEVASADQKTLELHFHHPLPGQTGGIPAGPPLARENLLISGGVRIRNIRVESATASGGILTVKVNVAGDFSFYTIQLVTSPTNPAVPAGFDPRLSHVEFSFKAGCPSDFDCKPVRVCPPEKHDEPDIDYLAKDYASFRRLMLDRLSVLVPDWHERSPADSNIALVEMLAYVGDHLSYFQDAVGTEAYLGTARKRVSVRRHARLLDYFVHEGGNARTWLFLDVEGGDIPVKQGTAFATLGDLSKAAEHPDGAIVFETMHPITARAAHSRILFYTWSNTECCLPKGATRATLRNDPPLTLNKHDLLLFEEERSPTTGVEADAGLNHRHVVRLTHIVAKTDPLSNTPVLEIEWPAEDALPFALCLSAVVPDTAGVAALKDISVARGNIVLADHGATRTETLPPIPADGVYRPRVETGGLTFRGRARNAFGRLLWDKDGQPVFVDKSAPASDARRWELRDVLPAVQLSESSGAVWHPLPDLLSSGPFSRAFVVEQDENGSSELRFGDNVLGQQPAAALTAKYRVGSGRVGNVGPGTVVRVLDTGAGIASVRNPMHAWGGEDPEPLQQVRHFAPEAFRTQERAVTEADWADVARRHPEVQKAAARFRWTGSWTTVYVAIDRAGGLPVDSRFKKLMRAHLEKYRLAGYDLEIQAPLRVPLDLAMLVCVRPGYYRADVHASLLQVLSNRILEDGRLGYFHPDNFTFGQPVYLSQLYAAATQLPGVASVKVKRFHRWGKLPNGEVEAAVLRADGSEIIQLHNDPNHPENGKLEFELHGGI